MTSDDAFVPFPQDCRDLLGKWGLAKYCDVFEEEQLIEKEYWQSFDMGTLRSLGMSLKHSAKFIGEAKKLDETNSPPVMESSWTAMVTRPVVLPHKDVLDKAEAVLRQENVKEMMRFEDSQAVFQQFWDQRGSLETVIDQLRQVFEEEVKNCDDPESDQFKQLVIFARFTDQNKMYNNVLKTYGMLHEQCILKDRDEWERCMDALDANSGAITGVYEQPLEDLIEMYPYAAVTQNRLRVLLTDYLGDDVKEDLAKKRVYIDSGFKSLYRILEKMAFHHVRRWSPDVWDMSRGMITYDTLGEIVNAVSKLLENEEIEVINIWNRFGREKKDEWQDVTVHIRFTDQPEHVRMISEIQLCLRYLTVARMNLGGHDEYTKYRSASEVMRFVDPRQEREAEIRNHL